MFVLFESCVFEISLGGGGFDICSSFVVHDGLGLTGFLRPKPGILELQICSTM